MLNWKTLAQLGVLAGSVALLSACGPDWACGDDCDEDEEVVYIEVEEKKHHKHHEEERDHREEEAEGYKK